MDLSDWVSIEIDVRIFLGEGEESFQACLVEFSTEESQSIGNRNQAFQLSHPSIRPGTEPTMDLAWGDTKT